ncbi:MAG: ATP-binding protein [Carnobacterium sp.]|uniref:ATP-binding protein n=1 Tax=Carnobacterium sp. TaxID=48221 RepID=UPI002FC71466
MQNRSEEIMANLLKEKSAATIYNEIEKLRSSSEEVKEKLRKRWVWELIQNAVDCCKDNDTIDIEIKYDGLSSLTFSHNGKGFREDDLWSIVTQTSSKQSDSESTGQFGTGFVTTSLLSPKIKINSFLEESMLPFELQLDRSGSTRMEVLQTVENNISLLRNLPNQILNRQKAVNTTTFEYNLNLSSLPEVAKDAVLNGIKSLILHIPYLMSFTKKIRSITINNRKYQICDNYSIQELPNSIINIIQDVNNSEKLGVMVHQFGESSLAVPVYFNEQNQYFFAELSEEISRLHCTFPLIGTEQYPFPMVLDSPLFNVEMDRNGIFESDSINMQIINTAIDEFNHILDAYSSDSFINTNFLCHFDSRETSEFRNEIKKKLFGIIRNKNMVESTRGNLVSINNQNNEIQLFVPATTKEEHLKDVWAIFSKIPNLLIPTYRVGESWRSIIKNDFKMSSILDNHFRGNTIEEFEKWFGASNVVDWLNEYYALFCLMYEKKYNLLLLPNSEGKFSPISELYSFNNVFPELEELFIQIDPSCKSKLIYPDVVVPESITKYMEHYTNESVSKLIENHIITLLAREASDKRVGDTEAVFVKALEFFSQYPSESERLFPTLYHKRTQLRTKKFTEELNNLGDLLSAKNIPVESINTILLEEKLIDALLNNSELSDDILGSLKHVSSNSIYSAQKVTELINRSNRNVYNNLKRNERYFLSGSFEEWELDKLSNTIFKAKKDGKEIYIVIRPSDEDKIIFYEDAELSVLESHSYELWTDNGKVVKSITLGDLLRTTNISVIPLKNLFGGE